MSLKGARALANVFELTRALVDIPSVTGAEARVGQFLAPLLEDLGYAVELQQVAADRANIIATNGGTPTIFFSTHLDTVPPYFPAREDEGFIHGRGACDAKGIIAAQICAAEQLRQAGCDEVGLLFTVDEESGSAGAKAANTHPLAATCQYLINGEPTDNRLAIGSKGSLQATIRTAGRAAHSAYPEQGDSAIEKLLDVLTDVRNIVWPASDTFGETTCNIGVISGGTRANVIPAEAQAVLQIRLATEATCVKSLLEDECEGRAAIQFGSIHNPQQMLAVAGFDQTTVRFTTDIPYLSNWGTPLLIGPGSILDAHTEHERVRKSDLLRAVELYCQLVRELQSGHGSNV